MTAKSPLQAPPHEEIRLTECFVLTWLETLRVLCARFSAEILQVARCGSQITRLIKQVEVLVKFGFFQTQQCSKMPLLLLCQVCQTIFAPHQILGQGPVIGLYCRQWYSRCPIACRVTSSSRNRRSSSCLSCEWPCASCTVEATGSPQRVLDAQRSISEVAPQDCEKSCCTCT